MKLQHPPSLFEFCFKHAFHFCIAPLPHYLVKGEGGGGKFWAFLFFSLKHKKNPYTYCQPIIKNSEDHSCQGNNSLRVNLHVVIENKETIVCVKINMSMLAYNYFLLCYDIRMIPTYELSPFNRQWRTCPGWTVRVCWGPCAFWAEECYGGGGGVWNWYEPAIRSVRKTEYVNESKWKYIYCKPINLYVHLNIQERLWLI